MSYREREGLRSRPPWIGPPAERSTIRPAGKAYKDEWHDQRQQARPALVVLPSDILVATATATAAGSSEEQTDHYGDPVALSQPGPNMKTTGAYIQDVLAALEASDDYYGEAVLNRTAAGYYGICLYAEGERLTFSSGLDHMVLGTLTSSGAVNNYGWNQGYTGIVMGHLGNNALTDTPSISTPSYLLEDTPPTHAGLWLRTIRTALEISCNLALIWSEA